MINDDMPNQDVQRGRRRSHSATKLIQKAALELAYEQGISYATVERIAARSGVAKTTIYRRWPNSTAIVMAGFLDDISPLIAYKKNSTIVDTMIDSMQRFLKALEGPRGKLLRHLMGAAQHDADLMEMFSSQWIEPRRQQGKVALAKAVETGELAADTNINVLLDLLYGAVYYRLTVSFTPLTPEFVEQSARIIFKGAGFNAKK